jgi:hypothetical protein
VEPLVRPKRSFPYPVVASNCHKSSLAPFPTAADKRTMIREIEREKVPL